MNKLKKLFSPSALAATVAIGLLVTSAINAWATCNTTSAVWLEGKNAGLCLGTTCGQQTCTQRFGERTYYWCCLTGYSCSGGLTIQQDPCYADGAHCCH